jgi:hypothetical protein
MLSAVTQDFWSPLKTMNRSDAIRVGRLAKNGGIYKYFRNDPKYDFWVEAVRAKDRHICQRCGVSQLELDRQFALSGKTTKGPRFCLNACYIKSPTDYPELRFVVDNGLTLCISCNLKRPRSETAKSAMRRPKSEVGRAAIKASQQMRRSENTDARGRAKELEWNELVKSRDDFTCQHCRVSQEELLKRPRTSRFNNSMYLCAHHIKDWDEFPELRYEVSNGLTLCYACHMVEEKRIEKTKEAL